MPTLTAPKSDVDAIRERVRTDTPFWAEKFGKVVNKDAELVPLKYKPGQLEFDRRLELQRAEDKPMRMIVLKARKVGISTATQAKLIQRCTLREHYNAVVVAQDRDTGGVLYKIGERLYSNLPDDQELKPELGQHRRSRFLHFAGSGDWKHGDAFPDSNYFVGTAGEYNAGRGDTPNAVHASEVAFWDNITEKLTTLKNAMPRRPETLFVIESTANGYNAFKDIWDDAEQGRSGYEAFFWPWWKEDEYRMPFLSEAEMEAFEIGDPNNPYAEQEPDLVENLGLDLEQLNWRRHLVADECNGDVRTFHQEYPATPEEAFIATGQKVFDSYRVAQLMVRIDITDPKQTSEENPGPQIGDLSADAEETQVDRSGNSIQVPSKALWTPRERGVLNPTHPFRLWLPEGEEETRKRDYIVAVDPSGGRTETTRETDYHAVQVIDHQTREQVAEYRSRIEPEQLAPLVLLTALFFNNAWVAIERTGGWGPGLLRILFKDFHYPFIYRPKRPNMAEKLENRLGWDTTPRTKPELVAGLAALLVAKEDGIKSRALANEVRTYTRTEKGTTEAEPGRFDDLLSAYMIAQQVARERPLANPTDGQSERGFVAGRQSSLPAYDPRLR